MVLDVANSYGLGDEGLVGGVAREIPTFFNVVLVDSCGRSHPLSDFGGPEALNLQVRV